MLKFKYHYLTNTLFYQKPFQATWNQVSEEKQFHGSYETKGFILEPQNHWITFQVKEQQIKAFYKLPSSPEGSFAVNSSDIPWINEKITYYRKYLSKKEEEIIFEFTEKDEMEKRENKWVKKEKAKLANETSSSSKGVNS